jgi:hypothetical protein
MLFALVGIELCGEKPTPEEAAFGLWLRINRPSLLTKQGQVELANRVSVETLKYLRSVPKSEFLEGFKGAVEPRRVHTRSFKLPG